MLVGGAATGYGYVISALSSSVETANALAPPLMGPLLLFGGFFMQSETISVYLVWVQYLSWFYYGAENVFVAQWRHGGACFINSGIVSGTEV